VKKKPDGVVHKKGEWIGGGSSKQRPGGGKRWGEHRLFTRSAGGRKKKNIDQGEKKEIVGA